MLDSVASGDWLTPNRRKLAGRLMLLATVMSIVLLLVTAHGTRDVAGRPIGTDFSNVYAAGRMALEGREALAWDWPAHYAEQQAIHGDPAIPFYGWHYPPPFLLLAAALACLPYLAALALWQASTLAVATLVVQRILPGRESLLLTLAAPVVLVCLGHGHNGFLTAALFGGGLMLLDRRPWIAGMLIGCMVYKPQFAVLLPLVLLANWDARPIIGAGLSAGTLVAATFLVWGSPVWAAFRGSLSLTRTVVIEQGNTGWAKIQTLFSAIRSVGGNVSAAYAGQALLTTTAIAGAVFATWRGPANARNAAILAAALLSTPYALDYDFTILGVAIAFLVAEGRVSGFRSYEISLLALAWAAPLFARQVAAITLLPLGLSTALAVFALAMRRVISQPDQRSRHGPPSLMAAL